jgi:plastocyanin domain-containing protein
MIRKLPQLRWCLLLSAILCSVVAGFAEAKPRVQKARIEINAQGYKPANLRLRRGVPARVTFVRTTDATCVREIVLSDFSVRRELPLNEPVTVSFTPKKRGSFTFACGMNMMRRQLIVR